MDDLLNEIDNLNQKFLSEVPENERVKKLCDEEPTEAELNQAAEEVKDEVIEAVDPPKQTMTMKVPKSQWDELNKMQMRNSIPGFELIFGTKEEHLPQFSRQTRIEAEGFTTMEVNDEILSGQRTESVRRIYIKKKLRYLQGIDGNSIKDFLLALQTSPDESEKQL